MVANGLLKYDEAIEHYRRLLLANPGKALVICEGGNVAMLEEGGVFGAPIRNDGTVELDGQYDFDISAFDTEQGCWDGETPELSWERINNPTFIDLSATVAEAIAELDENDATRKAIAAAYAAGYTHGVSAAEGGYVGDADQEAAEWIDGGSPELEEVLQLAGFTSAK
ncbi:hypothetical protein [Pseudomonas sp.]|uniref:hypothetical protein n=1 Tax=Pseudomonas sp. TaxID=306 RepID=UPI002913B5ED|nr:hypothetical protein [Pseudomonas sp.]MDU4254564.1 hypothetical protein [Pseudomonas sp.]